jgi:hypothetical protein
MVDGKWVIRVQMWRHTGETGGDVELVELRRALLEIGHAQAECRHCFWEMQTLFSWMTDWEHPVLDAGTPVRGCGHSD